jgi:PAS domain S-box-containing protein
VLQARVRDLEARLQLRERELANARRRFETLTRALPGMAYRCSNAPDWPMIWASPGALELTGYSSEEICSAGGTTYAQLIDPADAERLWQEVQRAIQEKRSFEVEYRIRRKDGEERRVWERGTPILTDDGSAGSLEGFITDMTSRARHLEAAKNRSRFLQTLLDAIPLSVFYKGTDTRYVGCNEAYAQFLGRSPDEIIGKNVFEIFPADIAQTFHDADLALLREPGMQRYEAPMPNAKGELRAVLLHKATYLDSSGAVAGLIGVIADQTEIQRAARERQELEAHLRQSQKNQALGTLAGGIAHDFNNILMTILGFTEMTLLDAAEGSSTEQQLTEVMHAAERAESLVSQILSFSRRSEPKRDTVDLKQVIANTERILRSSLPASIPLSVVIPNEDLFTLGDGNQLEQVVLNLVTNAAHAVEESGGNVELHLHPARKVTSASGRTQQTSSFTCIEIKDDGVGIPDENLDSIFDPYFTTKAKGKGTGLGLSVVQGIVQAHDGWIEVRSRPAGGTIFQAYLPIRDKTESTTRIAGASETPRGAGRILIVDDEESIAQLYTHQLESLGYRVDSFTDPMLALEAFEQDPHGFDAVLTDVTMPGMSGAELATKMLELRSDLPLVFCSGMVQSLGAARKRLWRAGEWLSKPVGRNELGHAIQRAIRKRAKAGH